MTEQRRDCLSVWILRLTLGAMVVGFLVSTVTGQSQDFMNATVSERLNANERRITALENRLDRLDDKLQVGLFGLVANLAVHLLQIGALRKK